MSKYAPKKTHFPSQEHDDQIHSDNLQKCVKVKGSSEAPVYLQKEFNVTISRPLGVGLGGCTGKKGVISVSLNIIGMQIIISN